jgi:hypothetical protein
MAMAPDFVVEVRDINFARIGQIDPARLDLKFLEVHRSIGEWELKLPAEHPLLPALKTKGSGIIITQRSNGRVFSGRTNSCLLSQDATDPAGTWVIHGYDDNVVAGATVAYPDPAHDADAQVDAYWISAGPGETLMKELVRYNAADLAIATRKYAWLSSAPNLARGGLTSCSIRFKSLAESLTDLGLKSGLGWRFYQKGAGIEFDVYVPQDKTDLIRLDIRNGGLEKAELGWTAPAATRVLVLGQGEGAERTVLPVTTPESLAEAAAWGLRWETAKDQRNTDDPTELLQAGQAILTEEGMTINSLKITPSDAPNQRIGTDWWLGDKVTVIIDGQPTQATVTQVATSISSAGLIRQVTVGDPVGFDWEAQIGTKVQNHEERVSALELAVIEGTDWAGISGKPTNFPTTWSMVASRPSWMTRTGAGGTVDLGTVDASTAPSSFPPGYSFGQVGSGFPEASGIVETIYINSNRAFQRVTEKMGLRVWVRGINNAAWGPFTQLDAPLPDPVFWYSGGSQSVGATNWSSFGSSVQLNLAAPAIVTLTFGAWGVATAGELRASIVLSGATSASPPYPGWGNTFYLSAAGSTVTEQRTISFQAKLNAGVTTIGVQAYGSGGGTKQLNYSYLEASPVRWAA